METVYRKDLFPMRLNVTLKAYFYLCFENLCSSFPNFETFYKERSPTASGVSIWSLFTIIFKSIHSRGQFLKRSILNFIFLESTKVCSFEIYVSFLFSVLETLCYIELSSKVLLA